MTDGTGAEFSAASESSWSARYKRNLARLQSGDRVQIAEVIGDLTRQDATRGLSAGEKRMLARALDMLS